MSFTFDYALIGYLIVAALTVFLVSGVLSMVHRNKELQLMISSALLMIIALAAASQFLVAQTTTVFGVFQLYPFSALFVVLFSITLLMVNFMAYEHAKDYSAFSLLFGFSTLGIFAITMANSLLTILLGIELMTIPTAFMIMINGKQYIEAAVKLFILSAVAVAVLAFGITLIFPYDAGLGLTALAPNSGIAGGYLAVLALLLFIVGLSFDASLFPFNLWVPDVYTGAPAYITAMLSGVNKKVAFVALFEILFIVMFQFVGYFSSAFQALAILTMLFGNLVALVQTNVKRLFAYSSISQAGYIALGFVSGTSYGIEAAIFQIIAHSFMIIGAFAIVLWLESKNLKNIQDYSGLSSKNGVMAFALTIFMLSLIGIPPLIGFIGKFLLFTSVISVGLIPLALIAILNSFISVYYYTKVILSIYSKRDRERVKAGWSINATVAICLIVVIIFGVFPQPLITVSTMAANSLFLIR